MLSRKFLAFVCLSVNFAVGGAPASARLTRIVVERTDGAASVSGAAPYEIIQGRFYGELDPNDGHNSIITDLKAAPKNGHAAVEYSATFQIARPIDKGVSSNVLFYDVPNRGNGSVSADTSGFIRVISGWQGDLPEGAGLQTARVPVAKSLDGKPLDGPVLARFQDMVDGASTISITGSFGLQTPRPEPVNLDTSLAKLYYQEKGASELKAIPSNAWSFGDCTTKKFPGTPDGHKLCLKAKFSKDRAYVLTYRGKNPLTLGVGFAATRDLVSFLRYRETDDFGTPNPAGKINWAVASGTSQSGNFLRSFVNLGFNADETDAIVFDGINPNIAARQVPLNIRFGVPGGAARAYEAGSEGTLWWSRYNDKVRGRGLSSLLDRCAVNRTCPKVIETFGSAEFWALRMAPGLIGTGADEDVPLPPNVRRYYFPSVTHGGSWTGGFKPKGDGPVPGCLLPGNPNPSKESHRAALAMLVAWVRDGKEPAPSAFPRLVTDDLVEPNESAMGWPKLPNAPSPENKLNQLPDYDFGPNFNYRDVSGVIETPVPAVRRMIKQLVPRVNSDGNETSGIASVQLQVPLGTYLGWNESITGLDKGKACGFIGGFIPFAATKAERLANGDPRPSLEERYGDHEHFVEQIKRAVELQLARGWLLPEDAQALVKSAEQSDVLK